MALGNPLPSPAFVLSVSDLPVGALAPSGVRATPVVGGGTFAAGTVFYVITATNGAGESMRSQEVGATVVLNGSVVLAWDPVAGATSYKVYRGTASLGENVFFAPGAATTLTDTGTAGTGGSPPALPATFQPVSLLNTWDATYNESVTEYDVFNAADPIEVNGRAKTAMTFGGFLPDSTDSGTIILSNHETVKDFFLVKVLWDGVNGFIARARVATKKAAAKAGPNLIEISYTFNVIPSSIILVGVGPGL
jgi:hypothetical protein